MIVYFVERSIAGANQPSPSNVSVNIIMSAEPACTLSSEKLAFDIQ